VRRITKLSEFIRHPERGSGDVPFTIYRGQREDWPLVPKVARCVLMDGSNPPNPILPPPQTLQIATFLIPADFTIGTPIKDKI